MSTGDPRPAGDIGCPTCQTILNAKAAGDCPDLWHSDNRPAPLVIGGDEVTEAEFMERWHAAMAQPQRITVLPVDPIALDDMLMQFSKEDLDEAYAKGITEGKRQLAEQIDFLTRNAYEDGKGDGRVEGRRQATEGFEREWGVEGGPGDPASWPGQPLFLSTDEADAHVHAARVPGRTVVSRLVGPWEPAEQASCPTCSGPIRETVGMVCQACGTDYAPAEQDGDDRG